MDQALEEVERIRTSYYTEFAEKPPYSDYIAAVKVSSGLMDVDRWKFFEDGLDALENLCLRVILRAEPPLDLGLPSKYQGLKVSYSVLGEMDGNSEVLWRKGEPSAGFDDCLEVAVLIHGLPGELYSHLTDIEHMADFFPGLEFKRDGKGPLKIGDTYYSKMSFERTWTGYRVTAVEGNRRLAAEQIGEHWLIQGMRYDHRLIEVPEGTISAERIEFSLRFGVLGRVLNRLFLGKVFRNLDLSAHQRLKEIVEKKDQD